MKKNWVMISTVACLVLLLLIPACSAEDSTPLPTSTPTVTPVSTPSPASTPATIQPPVATQTPEPEKTGTLKLSYTTPQGKTYGKGMEAFAELFEKATNGRYKVETYPANSLVSTSEAWDSTIGRKAEIVVTSTGANPTRFRLSNIPSIPTIGWIPQGPEDTINSWAAWGELINGFPELTREFEGVKLLNPMMMDPYFLVCKDKEVRVPADFKGMKVGCSGAITEIIKEYGGASVHQVPPQGYMNIDKGVTDACAFTFGMVNDYHMEEVSSYILAQTMSQVTLLLIMNQEAFDELSPSDQVLLEDVMQEALKQSAQGSWDSQALGRERWDQAGNTVAYPTPEEATLWDEAAVIAIRKWRDDAVDVGVSPEVCSKVLERWKEIRSAYGQK